jgi:hypothetical protein
MSHYDRGVKKIISVSQRLDSARRIHSDDEKEVDDARLMEHNVALEQVPV